MDNWTSQPLCCQADRASLSQGSRAAGRWLPGQADPPTTSFLESCTFWPLAACASSILVLKKMFQKHLTSPTTHHIYTQDEENVRTEETLQTHMTDGNGPV